MTEDDDIEPLEHPVSQWEAVAAAVPGGDWLFRMTSRNQVGGRVATAFDPVARVLYTGTVDEYDRLTHVEVTVPGDRLDAAVDVPRAGRELRAFVLSRAGERPPTPSVAEVAELLRRGVARVEIAALYQRPIGTVDNWTRQARREFPDLPQARRGPLTRQQTRQAMRADSQTPPATAEGQPGESPQSDEENRS